MVFSFMKKKGEIGKGAGDSGYVVGGYLSCLIEVTTILLISAQAITLSFLGRQPMADSRQPKTGVRSPRSSQ
jgi:hypothetical protein